MSVLLRSLSDSDILSRTKDLAKRERKITLLLLVHLNEIERRKLHLKQGYSSMFDYCTAGLGYSEPAAFRRIRTARCMARFPEVYALLENNQVNLTTIACVSRVLTTNNKDSLLTRIRGRSRREVEAIVAEYQPRPTPRDVVRPVVVRVPVVLGSLELSARQSAVEPEVSPREIDVAAASVTASPFIPVDKSTSCVPASDQACEKNAYLRREGDSHPTRSMERRVHFQFTATEEFQRKLDRIRTLAWHRLPANPSLEQVFELVMDEFIEQRDPRTRKERREKRASHKEHSGKAQEVPSQTCEDCPAAPEVRDDPTVLRRSRHIAAAVKDEVFVRDDGRCTFTGADGRRCTSKNALQIDHVTPFARGGASTLDNLRLLCSYHNRLESERLLGALQRGRGGENRSARAKVGPTAFPGASA